jgi:hypothetical protein
MKKFMLRRAGCLLEKRAGGFPWSLNVCHGDLNNNYRILPNKTGDFNKKIFGLQKSES